MDADGRFSLAFPRQAWWPACRTRDLRARRSIGITLWETPLAVFRDGGGRARAVLDRCAHRNVRLSLGRVAADGCLECPYHGWRYDGEGRCTAVPGLAAEDVPTESPRVASHAVTEADGFVWVWGEPDVAPAADVVPFRLPDMTGAGSGEVVFEKDLSATLHAALENHLDVPHTAFLHGGIFRGGGRSNELTAVRRDVPGGIEVEFHGEPVGMGPLRAGQGARTFEHWDRFFLPGIAQIEYRVEGWLRVVNTIVHLPLSPFATRAWFVVRWWSRLPAAVARPLVLGRGLQLLRQDSSMLAEQTRSIRAAGGERYTNTALDLFGNGIRLALRRAERGVADDGVDAPIERTITFRA